MGEELWRRTARELAHGVATKQFSAREVVDAHLERIEAVNGPVNAVVVLLADEARAAADAADQAVRRGDDLSPVHGVPFTVKSNIDLKGSATTEGVPALKDLVAETDAPMPAKLRRAGAIPLARTNMPDFGLRISTESTLYGATRNPWNLERTVGGSSGGDAAALATGMTPLGLGNDIGGSLRNPAFCCGVASIKPSFGRVAQGNDTGLVLPWLSSQLMLVNGVMARTVGDVRLGFKTVMGSDPRDPHAVDAPLDGPPRPKRVALVPEPPGGTTDPDIAEGVRVAGRALTAAGYEVEERQPAEILDAYAAWTELMMTSLAQARPLIEPFMGPDGLRLLELTAFGYPPATVDSLAQMHQTRYGVGRAFQKFFEEWPLIVGPTWTQKPFPLSYDIESEESALAVMEMFRFVLPANVLGLPVACVPTGVAGGLPTGVQVIGPRFREDLCLTAAEAIESAVGVLTPIDPHEPA